MPADPTPEKGAEEILPCPWCGANANPTFNDYDEYGQWAVECVRDVCAAQGPCVPTEAEAIAAWNRVARSASPDQPEPCKHRWITRRREGHPADETSGERVTFCRLCGIEDDGDDKPVSPAPPAAGTAEELEAEYRQFGREVLYGGDAGVSRANYAAWRARVVACERAAAIAEERAACANACEQLGRVAAPNHAVVEAHFKAAAAIRARGGA